MPDSEMEGQTPGWNRGVIARRLAATAGTVDLWGLRQPESAASLHYTSTTCS